MSINADLPNCAARADEHPRTIEVSQRKKEANRVNSLKSTGPKTTRGKNISRFNALQHGAYIKDLFILDGKHLKKYEHFKRLSDELQQELANGTHLEDKIFIQIYVMAVWRLELLTSLELAVAEQGGAVALTAEYRNFPRMLDHAVRDCERGYDRLKKLRLTAEDIEAGEFGTVNAKTSAVGPESLGE